MRDVLVEKNAQGSFLLEVMVALAIIACVASVVAYYQWNTISLYRDAQKHARALNLIQKHLEYSIAGISLADKSYDGIRITSSRGVPLMTAGMYTQPVMTPIHIVATWQSCCGVERTTHLYSQVAGVV